MLTLSAAPLEVPVAPEVADFCSTAWRAVLTVEAAGTLWFDGLAMQADRSIVVEGVNGSDSKRLVMLIFRRPPAEASRAVYRTYGRGRGGKRRGRGRRIRSISSPNSL